MKKTQNKNRKRLHLIALILGIYAVYLGSGLVLVGLAGAGDIVGTIRLLMGVVMVGFGLFGIWDGVRDIIRPPAEYEHKSPTQYILTDISGNRTSNVTMEVIRNETGKLREGGSFHLELLTPRDAPKWGALKQISCTAQLLRKACLASGEESDLLTDRYAAMEFGIKLDCCLKEVL